MIALPRYKLVIALVTWMCMCGGLLVMWQTPPIPPSITHSHYSPTPIPPHSAHTLTHPHIPSPNYHKVQGRISDAPSSPSSTLTYLKGGRKVDAGVGEGVERASGRATQSLLHQHPIRHQGLVPLISKPNLKSAKIRHEDARSHRRKGPSNPSKAGDYDTDSLEELSYVPYAVSKTNTNAVKNPNIDMHAIRHGNKHLENSPEYNDTEYSQEEAQHSQEYIDEINDYSYDDNDIDEVSDEYDYTGELGGRYNVTPINPSLLMYNRVPKCASTTMQHILKSLSQQLGFDHVSSLIYNQHQLSQEKQVELLENLTKSISISPSHILSYDRHLYYTNFTSWGVNRPVYVNIIRDPVDRFISSFYYRRSEERLSRIQARGTLVSPSFNWINRTLEDCVMSNISECSFVPGEEKEMILSYFCGHHPFCRIVGDQDALQLAKQVVSEEYSVVGLVDHMELSLELMETLVPRFLTGALQLYQSMRQSYEKFANKNQQKPEVPSAVRKELMRRMANDIDFYMFLEQRLYEQEKSFLLK